MTPRLETAALDRRGLLELTSVFQQMGVRIFYVHLCDAFSTFWRYWQHTVCV